MESVIKWMDSFSVNSKLVKLWQRNAQAFLLHQQKLSTCLLYRRFHGQSSQDIFFKMDLPRPILSFIFGLFKQTYSQILQQINVHPAYGPIERK